MTEILKKNKGKSASLTISSSIQKDVKLYKQRLIEMSDRDEVRPIDKITIRIIVDELEPYDQYLLLAYYSLQLKPSDLAKVLGTTSQIITTRINKIQNYVRQRAIDVTNDSGILN